MSNLNGRQLQALRHLWSVSALGTHHRAGPALDRDRMCIDLDTLSPDDYRWSSGELTLIGVARAIARNEGTLGDVANLDDDNRRAVVDSLRLWLLGSES